MNNIAFTYFLLIIFVGLVFIYALQAKQHKKAWLISTGLLMLANISLIFGELGTNLEENGTVQELGIILPLGAFFLAAGTLGVFILSLLSTRSYILTRFLKKN